ncbi:flagellar hook-associated protein 3 [Alkalibaculum sp. M08DMB]|uniref:Flagellar hook-associated protein 3 n=1 Tax=Alkalibaculum sporogenes TaxID=2655001 RepID=A0A6A7K5S0_9FIRM|nr:flagellar hook-associated protein FlgL [Alkalibaculum sporogenes]MPW24768.1 flagellar hook-associated protein 3 [Alkalibaculum sporogenes]
MRITDATLSNSFLRNLNRNLNQMQKYQNQLSSGKEVSKSSDNPMLVSKIMSLENNIMQNEQYNTNIKDSIGWVQTQDSALAGVTAGLQRIRDLIIYGANETLDTIDREAIKAEVAMEVEGIADVLNTNFDGRYIFAGQTTTTKPYSIVGNTLTYNEAANQGADKNIFREISKGVIIEIDTVGSSITSTDTATTEDLGELMNNIILALENGDTNALSGDILKDMDKHLENVIGVRSKVGATTNRLEAAESRNVSENLNLETLFSERAHIDIAEKYMEYSVMKTVYQASLSAGAMILQPSLLDYLR